MFDAIAPFVLSLVFAGICYSWAKGVRGGRSLTQNPRKMVFYATIFAFGMAYAILFQDGVATWLHWRQAWIAAIMLWAVLVGTLAWLRRHAKI